MLLRLRCIAPLLFWFGALGSSSVAIAVNNTRLLDDDAYVEQFRQQYGYQRNTVHISLDKPAYRPGDTVYGRAVLLDAFARRVPDVHTGHKMSFDTSALLQIVGPKGDVLHEIQLWEMYGYQSRRTSNSEHAAAAASVEGFQWLIPENAAGGEYKVRTAAAVAKAPAERSFQVKAYRAPRLNLRATLESDSYGFGDTPSATLAVKRAQGDVPVDALVSVTVRVDGQEVYRSAAADAQKVPASGVLTVTSAPLPATWQSGVGTLTVTVTDGGVVESTTVTLPLVTAALDISVYPEGGDLISDLPSRVYISAFLPNQDPADVAGEIWMDGQTGSNDRDAPVATVETVHEGRGVSTVFVPVAQQTYSLRITSPINQTVPLPAIQQSGATLQALQQSYRSGEGMTFAVTSAAARNVTLKLFKREMELASITQSLQAGAGGTTVLTVHPRGTPRTVNEGVLRATLYDHATSKPLAERLVYAEPADSLAVTITASEVAPAAEGAAAAEKFNSVKFAPASRVRLSVCTASDRTGDRVPQTAVAVTVTDGRARFQTPKRLEHPRLPAMALLETEVLEPTDPAAYLSGDSSAEPSSENVPAATALDLLLGTQGWRRFVFEDVPSFLNKTGAAANIAIEKKQRVLGIGEEIQRSYEVEASDYDLNSYKTPKSNHFMNMEDAIDMEHAPVARKLMAMAHVAPDMRGAALEEDPAAAGGTCGADAAVHEDERIPGMAGWEAGDLPHAENELQVGEDERIPGMAGWEAGDLPHAENELQVGEDERIPGMAGWEATETVNTAAAAAQQQYDFIDDDRVPGLAGWEATATVTTAAAAAAAQQQHDCNDDDRVPGLAAAAAAPRKPVHDTVNDDAMAAFRDDERIPGLAGWDAAEPVAPERQPLRQRLQEAGDMLFRGGAAMGTADAAAEPNLPHQNFPGQNFPEADHITFDDELNDQYYMHTWKPPTPAQQLWTVKRVFAHDNKRNAKSKTAADAQTTEEGRSDTTETVLFITAAPAHPDTGCIAVEFDLSDAVTEYTVSADAFSRSGVLGSGDLLISAVKPLFIEAKLPTQVVQGDTLLVPVTTTASIPRSLKGMSLHIDITASAASPLSVTSADSNVFSAAAAAAAQWSLVSSTAGGKASVGKIGVYTAAVQQSAEVQRTYLPVSVGYGNYTARTAVSLTAAVTAGTRKPGARDSVYQSITVLPRGFPQRATAGGMLQSNSSAQFELEVPLNTLGGTLACTIELYPTPVSSLTTAVTALVQEPYGCFEQTASTMYPMAMAMQYLEKHASSSSNSNKQHQKASAALTKRARQHLDSGMKKLLSFESSDGGFEWFGRSPGHEALTAYGVLLLTDLADIISVPAGVTERVTQWLISRRAQPHTNTTVINNVTAGDVTANHVTVDGSKTIFKRSAVALDSFGYAPLPLTDNYIVSALTAAGVQYPGRSDDLNALYARVGAASFNDPYELGLASSAMYTMPTMTDAALQLATKLAKLQASDGSVTGAVTSITNSQGQSLTTETTALAVQAWLHDDTAFMPNIEKAMRWLSSACEGGRFGSTQATVLALKAILAYENKRASAMLDSEATLLIEDAAADTKAATVAFTQTLPVTAESIAAAKGAPLMFDTAAIASALKPGHSYTATITKRLLNKAKKVKSTDGQSDSDPAVPWSSTMTWQSPQPTSSTESAVTMTASFSATSSSSSSASLEEGDTTEINVTVKNSAVTSTGMVVAIIGVPGGLEVRHERLADLRKTGQIAHFEVHNGQDVHLYWDGFAGSSARTLSFDAAAAVPGAYTGRASSVYQYYVDEHKYWVQPLTVEIGAAGFVTATAVATATAR